MSLNSTPSAERVHIGFFGRRNAGKSSVVNKVTGQDLAVVSSTKGTTTDPVMKAMELLPMGPVQIIDTPGIDDEGTLGELRIKKTKQILNKTDIAVLVADATVGITNVEIDLLKIFKEKNIPFIIAMNKSDLTPDIKISAFLSGNNSLEGLVTQECIVPVCAINGDGIFELKERIAHLTKTDNPQHRLVGDLVSDGDFVILVVPIDSAAPKGRLILPQQQTIRDILESNAAAIVVKENSLAETLSSLGKKPALVITDSQVFKQVNQIIPEDIQLTSFSILFARYKGNLSSAVKGAAAISTLQDGDTVLISEGCTHHRQCDDIGTVKLPAWLRQYTNKDIKFDFSSGTEFPEELSPYKMVIHCGACMLNEREVQYRLKSAADQKIPMTNYGTAIAYMNGILKRSTSMFPDIGTSL